MLKILQFPLELILFVALAYGIFRLFCRLGNSPRFSKTLKRAGGTAETDDDLVETLDEAEEAAKARAAEHNAEVSRRVQMEETLRRRTTRV